MTLWKTGRYSEQGYNNITTTASQLIVQRKEYLMMLEASSASGSAQYLLARIKQASADSIYVWNTKETNMTTSKHMSVFNNKHWVLFLIKTKKQKTDALNLLHKNSFFYFSLLSWNIFGEKTWNWSSTFILLCFALCLKWHSNEFTTW